MKPAIKSIVSPDVTDLSSYSPIEQDHFGFLLQLLIGPENGGGMESFEVTVCSPKWLSTVHEKSDIISGRHHFIMFEYDYDRLMNVINAYVGQCVGKNWHEVALKLARFAKWEFEDYTP